MGVDLKKAAQLASLHYMKSQQRIRDVLQKEARLRAQIKNIRDQMDASSMEIAGKMLGADLVWEAWVNRKLMQLNVELAEVLARKEAHMVDIRRKHGRKLVVDSLADKQEKAAKKQVNDRELAKATDYGLSRKPEF